MFVLLGLFFFTEIAQWREQPACHGDMLANRLILTRTTSLALRLGHVKFTGEARNCVGQGADSDHGFIPRLRQPRIRLTKVEMGLQSRELLVTNESR